MSTATDYTPPPIRTQDDIDALVAFVRARVKPLLKAATTAFYEGDESQSEQRHAFQALLDMVSTLRGAAQHDTERGDSAEMPYFYLNVMAREWDKHPDFLPGWGL